jgi:hypothetical protein
MNKLLLALLLLATPSFARTRVEVAGPRVTVETDRYHVVVDGLAITRIENRLTGEVYAAPPPAEQPSRALTRLLADRGVQVESLRPAVPLKRFGISDRTKVVSRKRDAGATVTFTGLQCGAEFAEPMTITLDVRVDSKTGDLLITPRVKGNIELVHGVRDRGVLRNSFHVLGLADNLKIVLPAADGVAFTAANAPADWADAPPVFRWPKVWEAALFVAESSRGCLGIWADEPALEYGRHLSLARSPGAWHAAFEFETNDLIYQCDEIKDATWRLNVFRGYWIEAARRYQQQMIAQWGMKPLAERRPAWADKIRIAVNGMPHDDMIARVPRDSMLAFTSQGWLKGWNDGQLRAYGRDYFPNWPFENPVRYEAYDGWAEKAAEAERKGVRVFPYTNSAIIDKHHPWIKNKIHDRHHYSWRLWQRFYPEQCLDIVQRYGVSGIYEDCSWVIGRHSNNGPDGENWYQGSVRAREYFKQRMPDIALCGERNNEVTARGQEFALTITQYPEHAHPIGCFLFEPFIRLWNLQPSADGMDADDIRGFISSWPFHPLEPVQDNAITIRRGEIFAHEQLRSHWPDQWDPAVLHYFKGNDGTEYRFVRDRGTRFVKLRPDSHAETIYWRVQGLSEINAPGAGIEGWLGYDGDQIIGLNPHVPFYVVIEQPARPPAVIASVPAGFTIQRSVIRDGYWLASLDRADNWPQRPAPDAPIATVERVSHTIRVRATQPVRFTGVESVNEIATGEYEVRVALPGGFGAYWSEPEMVAAGHAFGDPPTGSAHDRQSGVVFRRYIQPKLSWLPSAQTPEQEVVLTWLLQLPAEPVQLQFQYGTTHGHGDGANYLVRVNGHTLWKARRLQQIAPDKTEAPPIESGAVDLSAFAGQTVVFELADNGHRSGGSETRAWVNPKLVAK